MLCSSVMCVFEEMYIHKHIITQEEKKFPEHPGQHPFHYDRKRPKQGGLGRTKLKEVQIYTYERWLASLMIR